MIAAWMATTPLDLTNNMLALHPEEVWREDLGGSTRDDGIRGAVRAASGATLPPGMLGGS